MTNEIHRMVRQLVAARENVTPLEPPSHTIRPFCLEAAYQVGFRLQRHLEAEGFRPVGRKIGFTNQGTWKEFKLDTPIWAPVYDKTVQIVTDNRAAVSLGSMVAPRIEPEIVFKLNEKAVHLRGAHEEEKRVQAIEWVAIGFEIVDCHYPRWEFSAADAVADFGLHARLVVGRPRTVTADDYMRLEKRLPSLEVTLKKQDKIVAVGKGENALGSPLTALGHLADVLARQQEAAPLTAAEIITTGTLTPLPYIGAGERWRVEPAGIDLSPLELTLH